MRMSFPIVSEQRQIVGWTDAIPEFHGSLIREPEAERLLGGGIMPLYVRIEDPLDAQRAGAPADWTGAWRCLALCSARLKTIDAEGGILPVGRSARRAIPG